MLAGCSKLDKVLEFDRSIALHAPKMGRKTQNVCCENDQISRDCLRAAFTLCILAYSTNLVHTTWENPVGVQHITTTKRCIDILSRKHFVTMEEHSSAYMLTRGATGGGHTGTVACLLGKAAIESLNGWGWVLRVGVRDAWARAPQGRVAETQPASCHNKDSSKSDASAGRGLKSTGQCEVVQPLEINCFVCKHGV